MQRLLSVYDWQRLASGTAATFVSENPGQRAVRMRVNAPSPVALFVSQEGYEDEQFLAYVVGLDELQFEIRGSYKLHAHGGDVYFDTLDGTRAEIEAFDETTFTVPVERMAQDPAFLLMERKMQENLDRRTAALSSVYGAELSTMRQEIEALRTAAAAASAPVQERSAQGASGTTEAGNLSGATGGEPDGSAG